MMKDIYFLAATTAFGSIILYPAGGPQSLFRDLPITISLWGFGMATASTISFLDKEICVRPRIGLDQDSGIVSTWNPPTIEQRMLYIENRESGFFALALFCAFLWALSIFFSDKISTQVNSNASFSDVFQVYKNNWWSLITIPICTFIPPAIAIYLRYRMHKQTIAK